MTPFIVTISTGGRKILVTPRILPASALAGSS